jgi:ribosomal protein S12 methylthiotransferase
MRDDPRILPYFDIPFQHASAKVLRRMGRTGTAPEYLDLVNQIRSELTGAVIRTTFMVGFPGEGRREYRELRRFQEEGAFDWAGVFDFSREEGTKAYELQSALSERLRRRSTLGRKEELEKVQVEISSSRMERFVGETLRILVEERVQGEDIALGRGYIHAPEVDGTAIILNGDAEPGDWTDMRVIRRNNFDLEVITLDGRRKS